MTPLFEIIEAEEINYFSIPSHTAKLLIVLDEAALSEGFSSLQPFFSTDIRVHFIVQTKQKKKQILSSYPELSSHPLDCLVTVSSERLLSILRIQFIGTRLVVSGSSSFVKTVRSEAETAGFSDEEMQLKVIGSQKDTVFCVKCYSRHDRNEKEFFVCPSCRTELDVSSHYSKRHDAYLGYIRV
ncbi:dimethylamine monooxygenase subunit DmmA family protein [Domibacillus sp. DTU_2020_1001157_1_SI_ALB_TIR_016]|uniref:dimethylamine monooxygenase subunit DmmA family protein n=1 Tax=Domibacillus sp. DTU_2020_1001157_1_SI_ALB_TIR_016 TaxID=3077789 RepID=UPI0028EB7272|nr:dimethylamine monooxygenase subunit DmmA family protein [Domibacillus sp. DTU_2020_1001157_1_SI_ALB_TIR_016]WNS78040.1 dimethylamine monooxygenase subunit DmmA family protein [Domibacillus sp. DTU_2020_1001157_1_SI_ALB_TIR_016]